MDASFINDYTTLGVLARDQVGDACITSIEQEYYNQLRKGKRVRFLENWSSQSNEILKVIIERDFQNIIHYMLRKPNSTSWEVQQYLDELFHYFQVLIVLFLNGYSDIVIKVQM